MKNSIKIFLIISVASAFLNSCSGDKDDKNKLVRKIIEINAEGASTITFFKYEGDLILSSDGPRKHIEYSYMDGLILQIVTTDKLSKHSDTLKYNYQDGKLLNIISSENYIVKYHHNEDGTISYEKLSLAGTNQEKKIFHGTLYFENRNLMKDERILDDSVSGVQSSSKITFVYDEQNNPFCNIMGYVKLLDHNDAVSFNNSVMIVQETKEIQDEQVISSANLYTTTIKYDADNYPIEKFSEASINNTNYSKIQYFY